MKKLLIVACYFPPAGDVGAVRITKMVKYLLRKGWDITVLTVKEKYYDKINPDWLADVEGARIIRTPLFWPRILCNDIGTYWTPELYKALRRLLHDHSYDVSIWTGNPFYHWCLAPYFKKRNGLRYILDFRDPWRHHLYRWNTKSTMQLLKNAGDLIIAMLFEPSAVKQADRIINVNEPLTALYRQAYRNLAPEKFLTIPNGYDPEDMQDVQPIRISAFDIVFAGKFYTYVDPTPFFQAIRELVGQRSLTPRDLQFVWIGPAVPFIERLIKMYDLGPYITMTGFLPYRKTLQYIHGADVCLFISTNHASEGSTKLFDYMALNKAVLALATVDGAVRTMLKDYPHTFFSDNRADDIQHILSRLREGTIARPNTQLPIELGQYTREYQASQLDALLNSSFLSRAD